MKRLIIVGCVFAGIGFIVAVVLGARFFIKFDKEQTIKTTDHQKEGAMDY